MLNLVEPVFRSTQGEGKFTGIPSIFVRTTGCNLRCVFKDSICDTEYSSFHPGKPVYDKMDDIISDISNIISKFPRTNHVVITGGEPLLQREGLKEFLTELFKIKLDWVVTIETNGSLPILDVLSPDYKISLYSVSPKLATSVDHDLKFLTKEQAEHHDKTRINYKNLFNVVTSGVPYQFKFVYSGPECIEEIKNIYRKLSSFVDPGDSNEVRYWQRNNPNKNTWLMPEGLNKEQLESHCTETIETALSNDWCYSDRIHVRCWNTKTMV